MNLTEKAKNLNCADIIRHIGVGSIKETNDFLRKLYAEFSQIGEWGWNFYTWREGTKICIGMCNYGEVWIDYKQKGLINNIYIFTSKNGQDIQKKVEKAVDTAAADYLCKRSFPIVVKYYTGDMFFKHVGKNKISMWSEKEKKEYVTYFSFETEAFDENDLEYVLTQKLHYLDYLLSIYTNIIFDRASMRSVGKNEILYYDTEWGYDADWIDDFFENQKEATLLPEFFDLFRLVLDNDSYDKNLRLLLNSAQEFYCALLMKEQTQGEEGGKYNIPGYVDIINTVVVSVLEPLSNIHADKPVSCPACGNIVYKIRKRIENLCEQYMPGYLTDYISKSQYGQRSAFLHEGNARTNEFY